MAKLTSLQVFNLVANNLREAEVTVLTGLTGTNLLIFNTINQVIMRVGLSDPWRALETTGTITMVTSTTTYAQPSDYNMCDKYSFRYDNKRDIKYLDSQDLDNKTSDQNDNGRPDYVYETGALWNIFKPPLLAYNGDVITYRYWTIPTRMSSGTPLTTLWFPQGYEETVLVNMATSLMFFHRENPKAQFYAGLGNTALQEMKLKHMSPSLNEMPVRAIF